VDVAKLNNDGSIGTWTANSNALPTTVAPSNAVTTNGYIYVLGNNNAATVYYASVARVEVGGSLDLVGLQGQDLADPGDASLGSSAGSLTAGNGAFVGSLQTQGQANFATSANINGTLDVGDATNFKNSSNSTAAFQVLSSTGASLVSVDSTNSNVTLLGNNSGQVGAWSTASNALPANRYQASSIVANGYVYVMGGYTRVSFTPTATTYYAKLNSDGSVGSWTSASNAMPGSRELATSVTANGYVYVIGGDDSTGPMSSVYYAKLNSDGSVGSWSTAANALPAAREQATSVVANGYVYVMGGFNSTAQTTDYYAKLNSDGSVGSWSTTTALSGARLEASTVVANGYVYVIGGDTSPSSGTQTTVLYAKTNSDGTIGSWTTATNGLTVALYSATSVVSNGYLYEIGGTNSGNTNVATVYFAKLNLDGSVGSWTTATNSLPANVAVASSVTANGYIYEMGGSPSAANPTTTVYYASTSRLQIGAANLDLVGLQGQDLADDGGSGGVGSTGGSLTAGNGTFDGTLQVQGQANFSGSVNINGMLNVADATAFKNTANSTTAFKVQDAGGTAVLSADTTTDTLNVVNESVTGTLTVTGVATFNGGITVASGQSIKLSGIGNTQNVISKNFTCTVAVSAGDIVAIDTAHAGQVTKITTADSPLVSGVVVGAASAGATCEVAISGTIQANVDTGAIAVGDIITTNTTGGQGHTNNTPPIGAALGRALSSKAGGSSGSVWILMSGH
jgi:N-acetylneuraminic acid mutarotase